MNSAVEPEVCSKTEYAELRGVSTSYVSKLGRQQRLVLDSLGRIVVKRTDALVAATRDPTRGGDRTGKHARRIAQEAASTPQMPGDARMPEQGGNTRRGVPAAFEAVSLSEATRAEKVERTRLLQLDVAAKAGQLVRRDVVESETFQRARQGQEALMALKDRLIPLLAVESDERAIESLLDAEFRHICRVLGAATVSSAQTNNTEAAP